jgi:hypothetical protein
VVVPFRAERGKRNVCGAGRASVVVVGGLGINLRAWVQSRVNRAGSVEARAGRASGRYEQPARLWVTRECDWAMALKWCGFGP